MKPFLQRVYWYDKGLNSLIALTSGLQCFFRAGLLGC